jgi:hypothetical protein
MKLTLDTDILLYGFYAILAFYIGRFVVNYVLYSSAPQVDVPFEKSKLKDAGGKQTRNRKTIHYHNYQKNTTIQFIIYVVYFFVIVVQRTKTKLFLT